MGLAEPAVQCQLCKHIDVRPRILRPKDEDNEAGADFVCAAFPGGIPREIRSNERDHREPHPDDHGVRWEPFKSGITYPEHSLRKESK